MTAALALALVAVVAGLVATGFLEPLLDEYRFAVLFGVSLGMLRACVTSMDAPARPLTWSAEAAGAGRVGRTDEVGLDMGQPGMIPRSPESLVGWRQPVLAGRCRSGCRGIDVSLRPSCRGWRAVALCERRGDSSRGAGMDLRQVVRTVRANWIVALVTFLACLFIGGAYAVLPAKKYEASVVLVAQPPAGASDPGSDVGAIQIEIPRSPWKRRTRRSTPRRSQQVPARFRSAR